MISTSWSIPDSPGNRGWPSISSAITQPVDQMSTIIKEKLVHKTKIGVVNINKGLGDINKCVTDGLLV